MQGSCARVRVFYLISWLDGSCQRYFQHGNKVFVTGRGCSKSPRGLYEQSGFADRLHQEHTWQSAPNCCSVVWAIDDQFKTRFPWMEAHINDWLPTKVRVLMHV